VKKLNPGQRFFEDFFDAGDFLEDADFFFAERRLFTVAAAIAFARFVERPVFFSLALMCSYCRSSLSLHD
jgi:hypothetical protein